MEERLQKILAAAGVASRRHAEEIILAGRVAVNGQTVGELGVKADAGRDIITLDGKPLAKKERKAYILLNKPVGCLCTVQDTHGRPTVLDLVPDRGLRLYPVGRLDQDTAGLILLTNDGDFTQRILHPASQLDKVYRARVRDLPDKEDIKALLHGVVYEEETYKADKIRFLTRQARQSVWEITLHEGKKRQIRYMFRAIEHPVEELTRVRIGHLTAGDLKPGEWRYLKNSEVRELLNLARPRQTHEGGKRRGGRS